MPTRGKQVYILTSAQNNTGLHEAAWRNLLALAKHDRAELMCSLYTYNIPAAAGGEKKTSRERGGAETVEVWDKRLTPYVSDERVELAPGLVWCGELQILPTAQNPLNGFEAYTGAASAIIPHSTFAVEAVAVPKGAAPKFLFSTGTVTLRNYIHKKAGLKADFHHGYGALIVEVLPSGQWFARQLNADSEGTIYDLDRRIQRGRVTVGHRPEAIVWGDIHARQLDASMARVAWGKGGILDELRPKRQVMHDVLDFRSQNHHDRGNPWRTFGKHCAGGLDVAAEVDEVGRFLAHAARPWCETVVVPSNHDEALDRWLREADFRADPLNAEFHLTANLAAYRALRAGKSFQPLRWGVESRVGAARGVRWLERDERYIVCPDAGGGIQLDMHGDVGPNGTRGSLPAYARTGLKTITGHSHRAGLRHGAMSVGVMGALDQGYNVGLSSWSHTNAVVFENGKRQLFTISGGRFRA